MSTSRQSRRPRALVVYESMFGNTAAVARAIGEGLASEIDVEVRQVAHADPPDEALDLIVLGGPTHAFSLSRPSTRADARRQGGQRGRAANTDRGLREWLSDLQAGPHHPRVVTFDTRVAKVRHLPGSAAKRAARLARSQGYEPLAAPASFFVDDVAGPLLAGELDRAEAWAEQLAVALQRIMVNPDPATDA